MNESDNKTRIKKPAASSVDIDNSRTRVAVPNKTRIKPNIKNDATQFRKPDKNIVSPQPKAKIVEHAYSYDKQSAGHHGVLKERFILAKVIGSGGMGVVYKAKDLLKVEAKDRDPYVAIKVLSEEFKSHPEAFISLQRESRKSQRIAHPNIVNVFDFDRDGDVVFMTMEFMDGRPLDRIIRQYKSTGLPSDDAWGILKSICDALVHAHGMNIIHSDFKPGNIFVTNSGVTKVFDFGIARAVAKVTGSDGGVEDRTVFDAGNLGALTPAYASLEMLQGMQPDARDDIYALGCIAYELFAGVHPFKKLPADEAMRQGLTPQRITNISKRQWKAIKQALSFKREDRLASVEEFLELITKKSKRNIAIPIFMLLFSVASIFAYSKFTQDPNQGFSESEIRSKVEFELQLNFHRKTIENLMRKPIFTPDWEDQLWQEYIALNKMLVNFEEWTKGWTEKEDSQSFFVWMKSTTNKIYALYLKAIRDYRVAGNFKVTQVLIDNAARYTVNVTELKNEKVLLARAIEQFKQINKRIAKKEYQKQTTKIKKQAFNKKRIEIFNVALDNVNQQLRCQSKLNMRNIDVAIKKLKSYNISKYRRLKPKIVKRLASCITELGKPFPSKAHEYKKYALRIFRNNSAINAIRIIPRDPCNISIAGLGARGKRTVCKDKLKGIAGSSPDLIVIVGDGSINNFAISKYEVSNDAMNKFCKASSQCDVKDVMNSNLPATNINFKIVKNYLKWLTKKTGKKYRLPSKNEWLYAAAASNKMLDPNRNCYLRTRGIEKGERLFASNVGLANPWGMVNYIGNAREWVYGKGRQLVAVGGSYNSPMESCNFNTQISSIGEADKFTGFRVLREINN